MKSAEELYLEFAFENGLMPVNDEASAEEGFNFDIESLLGEHNPPEARPDVPETLSLNFAPAKIDDFNSYFDEIEKQITRELSPTANVWIAKRSAGFVTSPLEPDRSFDTSGRPAARVQRAAGDSLKKKNAAVKKQKKIPAGAKTPIRILKYTFNTVLSLLIVVIFTVCLVFSFGDSFLGFYIFNVISDSMQDEIPLDSLVISRRVNVNTLRINDDITFRVGDGRPPVTHRIVEVIEDYKGDGAPGFRTKGTSNDRPDYDIVEAGAVIGKVVFHTPRLGKALLNMGRGLTFILLIILAVLAFGLWIKIQLLRKKP